jgi:hypothetical protein
MSKARDLANAGTALTTVSATELGYLDGVTSAVQTQINAKQAVVSGVNDTEIGYLDGVTSAIQTQLDAKIAKTLTTTTGDIIYASSANTPARLGIGTTDQILKVTAGVPAWATPAVASSGLTKLVATTFSAVSSYSAPAATFSATYNQYLILVEITSNSANTDIRMRLRTSGTDATANDYHNQEVSGIDGAASAPAGTSTSWNLGSSSTNTRYSLTMNLFDPFATGQHLQISESFALNSAQGWSRRALGGRYDVSTSYDAFTLYPASGTITGRIAVYGYAL